MLMMVHSESIKMRTDVKDDAPNKGKTISTIPFSPYNKITVDMLLHKNKMRQFH